MTLQPVYLKSHSVLAHSRSTLVGHCSSIMSVLVIKTIPEQRDLSAAWGCFNKLAPPLHWESHSSLFSTEKVPASLSSKAPWTPPYTHIQQGSPIYLHLRMKLTTRVTSGVTWLSADSTGEGLGQKCQCYLPQPSMKRSIYIQPLASTYLLSTNIPNIAMKKAGRETENMSTPPLLSKEWEL